MNGVHAHRATVTPFLDHDLPVGSRVMRYGMGVSAWGDGETLWWCRERRMWTTLDDNRTGLSSHAPCKTVRAFRRHLRRHGPALAGRVVVWSGRFGNVTADLTATEDVNQKAPT